MKPTRSTPSIPRPALPWIIAALVVYLVAFFITAAVNVPLNEQLARAGDPAHISNLAAVRQRFEHTWVSWNIVRALAHTVAFGCLAWALVLYGAHRDKGRPAGKPPSAMGGQTHHAASPGGLSAGVSHVPVTHETPGYPGPGGS